MCIHMQRGPGPRGPGTSRNRGLVDPGPRGHEPVKSAQPYSFDQSETVNYKTDVGHVFFLCFIR